MRETKRTMNFNPSVQATASFQMEADGQLRLFKFLAASVAASVAFHMWTGIDELQRSHILLGRNLLFGEPYGTPANPMWGYSLIMAAVGKWAPVVNGIAGFCAFVFAYRALELGRALPTLMTYLGIFSYAAIAGSWHDTAPWLALILTSIGLIYRYGFTVRIGAIAALLWGAAYNIRSEALLLFLAFLALAYVYERLANRRWQVAPYAIALLVFLATLVPWGIYTQAKLGYYSPSSTNGGAVAYYGLGLVPNNSYNIHPKDEFVYEMAEKIGEASPWSGKSNKYFLGEYVKIISSDPKLFVQKLGWGVFTALRSGPYVPDVRKLVAKTPSDIAHLMYAGIDLKRAIGIPEIFLSADNELIPIHEKRQARRATVGEYLVLAILAASGMVFKLALLASLVQVALLLRAPKDLLRLGPAAPLAAATVIFTLVISALLIPSVRLNTVLLTFSVLLLQMHAVQAAAPVAPRGRSSGLGRGGRADAAGPAG
jgi:hypothetical protein